jgi:hypothetical protein
MMLAGAVVVGIEAPRGFSGLIAQAIVWPTRFEVWWYAEEVQPWTGTLKASDISSAADLYGITNVWPVHLEFTRAQWNGLDPRKIETLPNFITSDGKILVRNPKAPRSGFAGVLGYAFDWSGGDLDFGGERFDNVGVRIKGNVGALIEPKRPFKLDLNRFVQGQKLAGLDELTFNNLMWDTSYLRDALAYELFRDAGVPAPRTAYAWITATVEKRWNRQPLGLYLLLESVDEEFALDRFGSRKTPIFKPVTYDLFEYLGDQWEAYAAIYDLKTKATAGELRRIIEERCRIRGAGRRVPGPGRVRAVSRRAGFAGELRWLADDRPEFLYVYRSALDENRFHSVGFGIYRARLEEMLNRLFTPERIQSRVDEIAPVLRGPIAAESKFRLDKFEQEAGIKPVIHSPGEIEGSLNAPAYPYRKFVEVRARSVRDQLDGKSKGLIIPPMSERF